MPISISLRATGTKGGVTHDVSGTAIVNARKFSHNTRDISNTFQQIAQAINGCIVIFNNGDEAAFIQLASTAPHYIVFQCVPGAHLVIPTSIDHGSAFTLSSVNARSETSAGTNITVICIDA